MLRLASGLFLFWVGFIHLLGFGYLYMFGKYQTQDTIGVIIAFHILFYVFCFIIAAGIKIITKGVKK